MKSGVEVPWNNIEAWPTVLDSIRQSLNLGGDPLECECNGVDVNVEYQSAIGTVEHSWCPFQQPTRIPSRERYDEWIWRVVKCIGFVTNRV